ncbi:MAG TPA: carboxypeptidase regulatory-like domain-containing protein [Myxococcota bacterium]|jgi:outer membrane protein OmpA-like peptidoglycan-associated protein|nr:carboxypeptidase regulatory-like domain-containing protein [Myxococcota bacterium]
MAGGAIPIAAGGNQGTVGTPLTIQVPPRVFRVRLTGLLFDTDKCFLLASGLKSIRAFKKIWNAHPDIKVLVVGHADKAGAADHNQKLSERRAESIKAYLTDDVDAWLKFYSPGVPPTKLWGATEDQKMLAHLRFGSVSELQTKKRLAADGVAGPDTRRALITDYMAEDQTQKPASAELQTHGCGESHPDIPTDDSVAEERNRRVEIFLFEQAIDPAPVNPCPQPAGCQQHATWKGLSRETIDLGADLAAVTVTVTDTAGAPVPQADVHLAGFVPEDAQTDASGAAPIADVVPTSYEVFARKQGFESASTKITVPAGATVAVPLTLKAAAGTLKVVVRDGAAAAVAGATVNVAGPNSTADSKTTDGAGGATFGPVPAGAYTINVTAPNFQPAAASGAVNPDQTTTVAVTLPDLSPGLVNPSAVPSPPAPTEPVELRLFDLHRQALANHEATVTAGTARAFATTDSAGVLKVDMPVGTTAVVVTFAPPDAAGLVDWPVQLGLPGVDTDAGLVGRLKNLGYPADADRDFALFSFHADTGVPTAPGDLADDALRQKLVEVHGS